MFENEKIVETKICKHCNSSFYITDKDLEFYDKISPEFGGIKYNIPSPTLCPDCRSKKRLVWRNERKIYRNKCDSTGKEVISCYSSDKPYKKYLNEIWWSDKWDPLSFGKYFDFEKNFFDQFNNLLLNVPRSIIENLSSENSDFNNCVGFIKDCYMIFASGSSEKCIHGNNIERSTNCIDTYLIFDCENCYDIASCYFCNNLYFSFDCKNCSSSYYLYDCQGCNNCFGCVGLKDKNYFILNKQYSKEEYKIKIDEYLKETISFKEKFNVLKQSTPRKYIFGFSIENSFGDDIVGSRNCNNCYIMENCVDCKNSSFCRDTNDSMDFDIFGYPGELSYESVTVGLKSYNVLFSNSCMNNVNNLFYCDSCYVSSNLFGCTGLRNKSYCILNKQYSKEEYEILVPKIIEHMIESGEWGEFFPSSLSPFGYNETVANEYFPLKKEEAIKQGFNWSDYESPFPKVEKIIPADKLPYDIKSIPDDILNWAIECEVTKKPFKIIAQELEFYRKHNLPIPKRHPDQRHLDRMKLRNPRKLYDRICDKCGNDIKTTYSPDRSEIVYCEECYNKEVY